jgi:hypothetical protein
LLLLLLLLLLCMQQLELDGVQLEDAPHHSLTLFIVLLLLLLLLPAIGTRSWAA